MYSGVETDQGYPYTNCFEIYSVAGKTSQWSKSYGDPGDRRETNHFILEAGATRDNEHDSVTLPSFYYCR